MPETPRNGPRLDPNGPTGLSRRTAVKVAAAAGIGAVVWAEPTIRGLARRPAYAETASGNSDQQLVTLTGTFDATGGLAAGTMLTADPESIAGDPGVTIEAVYQEAGADGPRIKLESSPTNRLRFDTGVTAELDPPALTSSGFSSGVRLLLDLPNAALANLPFSIEVEIFCR